MAMFKGEKVGTSTDEAIKRVLRGIMLKLGIRAHNLPSEEEKAILLDHIRSRYPDCTLQVMALAFEMAIVGKLDVEVNCFENFSCMYFSKVIEAYRTWAKKEFSKAAKELPAPEMRTSEDISQHAMEEWLEREIYFIKTGKPVEFVPVELYDFLVKQGKITATREEKFAYLQKASDWRHALLLKEVQAKNSTDNRTALQDFRMMRENGCYRGREIDRLKDLAKKLLFFDHVLKSY